MQARAFQPSTSKDPGTESRAAKRSLPVQRSRADTGLADVLLGMQRTHGNQRTRQYLHAHAIQRACACGGKCGCEDEEEPRRARIQRQADGPGSAIPGAVTAVSRQRGGGAPLPPDVRATMEPNFGQDFSGVRVHTGQQANRLARDLNAHAFTTGRDIYFASGRYAPESTAGRRLLSHELTHVVQQRNATAVQRLAVGESGDAFEREADAAATAVVAGRRVVIAGAVSTSTIQRQACEHDRPTSPRCPVGIVNAAEPDESAEQARQRIAAGFVEEQLVQYASAAGAGTIVTNLLTYQNALKDGERRGFIDVARISATPTADGKLDVTVAVGELKTANTEAYPLLGGGFGPPGGCAQATREVGEYIRQYTPVNLEEILEASRQSAAGLGTPRSLGWRGLVTKVPTLGGREFATLTAVPLAIRASQTWPIGGDRQGRRFAMQGNNAGGFSYRCLPRTREPRARRGGRKAKPIRTNPPLFDLEYPDREYTAGERVRVDIPTAQERVLPGLRLRQGTFTIGPDLELGSGQITAASTIPLVPRSTAVTIDVDETGLARIDFRAPIRLGAIGETELHVEASSGRLRANAAFTPAPRFLRNARAEVSFDNGELSGGVLFTPEAVQLPVPGLTVSNVRGGITFDNRGIAGEGGMTLAYQNLGQADVAVRYARDRLTVDGDLVVQLPGMEPVTGAVGYRDGRLAAQVRLTKEHFPASLPIQRGAIVVRLSDGEIAGSGSVGVGLGRVGRGDLEFSYLDGNTILAARIGLTVPGLQDSAITLRYRDGQLEGEAEIPIASDRLPGLSGILRAHYRDARFGGETQIAFRRGELAGAVLVRLEQLEDGSLAISGGGEVAARIAPWLTGRVNVELTRTGDINVVGEIRAPAEVELFRRREIVRERTFPRLDIPLWGFTVPVVGSRVGIVAFIEGGAGFTIYAGPGVLRNIGVVGSFSTQEGQSPSFEISGEFVLPAGAEAYLFVGGGIALGAAVVDISGSIRLRGTLDVPVTLSVVPQIGYRDGEYYFRGAAEVRALSYLRFSGAARAAISIPIYGDVWSEEWPLFDWVYPLGLNIGLRGRLDYTFGRPFEPQFELEMQELDPTEIARAAVPGPGARPRPGPAAGQPPVASISTETVPGARPPGARPAAPGPAAGPQPPRPGGRGPTPPAPPPRPAPRAPVRTTPPPVPTRLPVARPGVGPDRGPGRQPGAEPSTRPVGARGADEREPISARPVRPPAPALPRPLAGAAPPVAAPPPTGDTMERWRRGLEALEALVSTSNNDPFTEPELDAALARVREQYGFRELRARLVEQEWDVYARMNPDNRGRPIRLRADRGQVEQNAARAAACMRGQGGSLSGYCGCAAAEVVRPGATGLPEFGPTTGTRPLPADCGVYRLVVGGASQHAIAIGQIGAATGQPDWFVADPSFEQFTSPGERGFSSGFAQMVESNTLLRRLRDEKVVFVTAAEVQQIRDAYLALLEPSDRPQARWERIRPEDV